MARKAILTARAEGEQYRPPVVAVLGHVDHGKTTLLDSIRRANVVASEAGGITQHIGAYQVKRKDGKKITFIDTPGHLVFSKMRSRGARVADLVVLVIAVDEGFKPQTLESLKHIQSAGIPYLVALTKVDLPNTDVERVKKELVKHGIELEKHGGDIVSVPVSGKTGKGIDDLLEMIIILAEMAEIKGGFNNLFKGVVIESKLDSRCGSLATVLVQDGNLKVGDEIVVGSNSAKIKAMFDENGKRVEVAGPSVPVEILGFKEIPAIGTKAKKLKKGLQEEKSKAWVGPKLEVKKTQKASEVEEEKLKVILKADSMGTLEAITNSMPNQAQILYSGVGDVNGSDILLAETTGAEVIAFGVKVSSAAKKLAETEKIEIATFKIIYRLLEEVEKKALKMSEPGVGEEVLGRAEVLQEFEIKKERVAGCRVIEGEIKKTDRFHLQRDGEVIGDCRIKSLKTGKRIIERVEKGEEFGAILSPSLDFSIGDVLISYRKA